MNPAINHYPGFENAGTLTPDNLIAGDFPLETKTVTVLLGENLTRGTVLGTDAVATTKYIAVDTDAKAAYVLAEDCDATAADKTAIVYMTGSFNSNALTLGVGATLAGVTATLEAKNIYIRDAVKA